jgi:spore germination protein YaaH
MARPLAGPMTHAARAVAILAAASMAVPAAPTVAPLAGQAPERLFYYVDNENAYASFRDNVDRIDIVAPSAFSVDADGILWGEIDRRVLRLAREHGVRVMPYVNQPGFDQEMLTALLADDAARRRAIGFLLEACRQYDLYGIQFDFENISVRDRDAYTRFYQEAATALRAEGYRISMAVVHRPGELPGPSRYHAWLFRNWRAGYDLEAIGRIGDFVTVMTYSQHTRRTPPGPNASVAWDRDVIEYFLRYVPAEKLSLGIPTVSQHWYTSQEDRITPEMARSYSATVTYDRARALIERNDGELHWSETHQVAYAFFSRGGTFEWVFMEDARSFRSKLDLVREFGLRGFSVWVLGYEDREIWPLLPAARGGP